MVDTAVTAEQLLVVVDTCLSAGKAAEDGTPDAVGQALEQLKKLEELKVTTQLLKDTAAGKKIRKLVKHVDSGIVAAATQVIETWKDAVRKEQEAQGAGTISSDIVPSSVSNGSQGQNEDEPQAKRQKSLTLTASVSQGLDVKRSLPPVMSSGNPDRDKVRGLLAEALALALQDVPGGDLAGVSAEVEEAMHRHCGGVKSLQYKTQVSQPQIQPGGPQQSRSAPAGPFQRNSRGRTGEAASRGARER
eukprot:jgi/Botrbrau1/4292/Bobra.0390s0032.1